MILALLIGRGGSVGLPNKNILPILGRPMMAYPLLAAKSSKNVNEIYLSTDSKKIINVGKKYGAKIINRPKVLASSKATVESVLYHGHKYLESEFSNIEFIVVLMCNAVMILPETIDKGIKILRKNPSFDSAVTVSDYNKFTPTRARKIGKDGSLKPFIPLNKFKFKIDSNRQKKDSVLFHDCGVSVVRPNCLKYYKKGLLPQQWMGKKIFPLQQSGGLDVDYDYDLPLAEKWLKEKGFSNKIIPYKK